MKKQKSVALIAVLLLFVSCIGLTSCSRVNHLIDNTKKNMKVDKNLPMYNLNKENFKEISYKGKRYRIENSSVIADDLDQPIGKIQQRITIDGNNKILNKKELMKIDIFPDGVDQVRIDLNFGWVYSLKGISSDKTIAVVVNEKYRKAVIK